MPKLYKHNTEGDYCRFQDGSGDLVTYPHIIEMVFNKDFDETKVQTAIKLDIESKKFDSVENEYYDNQYGFFDRAIIYNRRQCSGDLFIKIISCPDSTGDFFDQQLQGLLSGVTAVKKEGNWVITGFRNYVITNNKTLFSKEWSKIKNNFPIDKVVNTETVSSDKDWYELEMFRDKYLIVRLIDTHDYTKQLITRIVNIKMTTSPR